MKSRSGWGIFAFAIMIGLAAFGQQYQNAVLAIVGGEVITTVDVGNEAWRMERTILANPSLSDDEKREQVTRMRRRIADTLVERELMFLEFKRRGFQVPPQLVVKRTSEFIEREAGGSREAFYKRLRQMNITLAGFREMTSKDIAIEMLMGDRVYRAANVPYSEIESRYEKNKENYAVPAKIRLQAISIGNKDRYADRQDEALKEVVDKLKAGEDFGAVAEAYSDVGAKNKGYLEWAAESELSQVIAEKVKDLKTGTYTSPFKLQDNWVILNVAERIEANNVLTTDVRSRIARELRQEKIVELRREYVNELTRRHFVQIHYTDSQIQNVKRSGDRGL